MDPKKGRVYWLDRKEIFKANFIWNMKELLEIFESDTYSEFFFEFKDGKYQEGQLLG